MADDNTAPAMGEPTTDDSDAEQMLADAVNDDTKQDDEPELGDAGKRALERERRARREAEARLKDLEPLAQKAKELEDAKKTELEKLTEQLQQLQAQHAEASSAHLRLEVALDKAPEGMSMAQVRKLAKRLTGSNREELEADAEELFAEFAPAPPAGGRGRQPKENLRSVPLATNGSVEKTDMNEWMRERATPNS